MEFLKPAWSHQSSPSLREKGFHFRQVTYFPCQHLSFKEPDSHNSNICCLVTFNISTSINKSGRGFLQNMWVTKRLISFKQVKDITTQRTLAILLLQGDTSQIALLLILFKIAFLSCIAYAVYREWISAKQTIYPTVKLDGYICSQAAHDSAVWVSVKLDT